MDLNVEKIKTFNISKQEFNNKLHHENTGLNKFGLFNSVIEVNTNQNANPIYKIQAEPSQSMFSNNTKDLDSKSIININ